MKMKFLLPVSFFIACLLSVSTVLGYENIAKLEIGEEYARSVVAKDNYAYALTRDGNLYTFNISDIAALTSFVTRTPTGKPLTLGKGNGILRFEDKLYAYGEGVAVISIQNPEMPVIIKDNIPTRSRVNNMILSSGYLIACAEIRGHNTISFRVAAPRR